MSDSLDHQAAASHETADQSGTKKKKAKVALRVRPVAPLALLLVLFAAGASAQPRTEAARFVETVVEGLASAQAADDALPRPAANGATPEDASNAITAYRRAISSIEFAVAGLEPYLSSKRESFVTTAAGFQHVYGALIGSFEGSLQLRQKLVATPQRETAAAEANEYAAMAAEAWRSLPFRVANLAHALLDWRSVPDGISGFILVTDAERAELLEQIELLFGTAVAGGKSDGLQPSAGAAGLLAGFLRQPWPGADQR